MDDPSTWAFIWLAIAAMFAIGELLMAGSFFLFPFAVGGLAASLVTAVTGSPQVGLLVFIVVSLISFFAMRPMARRLDANAPDVSGIGANRLIGVTGVTTQPVAATPGGSGMVRVGGEEWRAEALNGVSIPAHNRVTVVEVRGTRLVVRPADPEPLR